MTYENTYSSNNGKYQKAYDIIWKELVPKSGRAHTELGELLRRFSRVYYRYYNDGDTYDDLCDDEFGNAMMRYFDEQKGIPQVHAKKVHYILFGGNYEKSLEDAVNYILRTIMLNKSTPDKIYNPETGRLVGVTTPTGLKALKQLGCKITYSSD